MEPETLNMLLAVFFFGGLRLKVAQKELTAF